VLLLSTSTEPELERGIELMKSDTWYQLVTQESGFAILQMKAQIASPQ
jgi:hypothetical protein